MDSEDIIIGIKTTTISIPLFSMFLYEHRRQVE